MPPTHDAKTDDAERWLIDHEESISTLTRALEQIVGQNDGKDWFRDGLGRSPVDIARKALDDYAKRPSGRTRTESRLRREEEKRGEFRCSCIWKKWNGGGPSAPRGGTIHRVSRDCPIHSHEADTHVSVFDPPDNEACIGCRHKPSEPYVTGGRCYCACHDAYVGRG